MSRLLVIALSLLLTMVSVLKWDASQANAQFGFGGEVRGFEFADGVPVSAAPQPPKFIDDMTLLSNHGIKPDRESFGDFLRGLVPDEGAIERGREWILQLGDADYQVRTEATNQLVNATGLPDELFLKAIEDGDPERAFRCRQILDARSDSLKVRLRVAVFRQIREQKTTGLVDRIVAAYPQLSSKAVQKEAALTIIATAEKHDVATLIRAAESDDSVLKLAALESLLALDPDEAMPLLKKISQSDDEALRLESGRLYAQLGRSECLDILVELLDAENVTVRSRAFIWLRRITGQDIPYATWESSEVRKPAIEKLTKWVAAHRDTLKIDFKNSDPKLGRILVGLYGANKVVEFDMTGKQIWEAPLASAFCCQGLPNGHRIVGQYGQGRIVEYDNEGELFKEFNGLPAMITSIQRLENGNTLVAAGRTGEAIFELDPEGKKIWEKKLAGTPIHAWLLPSRKIMVCFYGSMKVCEIDRKGTVTWEIAVDGKPYSASRLENGNTLVALYDGGMVEYDPDGEKIREFPSASNTYHGELMDDGNLIYADNTGIYIVDPTGKKVREITDYDAYLYLSHY